MKNAAIAALLSCSLLTPVTPALAAPQPTQADMQHICDSLYKDNQFHPELFRTSVHNINTTPGTSTQVAGSERDTHPRVNRDGHFHYAAFTKANDPLVRKGGSPNMWGTASFSEKVYEDTLVDIEIRSATTPTYNFGCQVEQHNEFHGFQVTGFFNQHVIGDEHDDGYSVIHHDVNRVGTQFPGLDYIETGSFNPDGTYTLACNSPSGGSKGNPGEWRAKPYYTGGHCNTVTFNAAPTVAGREFGSDLVELTSAIKHSQAVSDRV